MKSTITLLIIMTLIGITKECKNKFKPSVNINEINILDLNNNFVYSTSINTKLKLSINCENVDSINYKNILIKIIGIGNDSVMHYEKYSIENMSAKQKKNIKFELGDKLTNKLGIINIIAEIFYDSCLLDKKTTTIQIVEDSNRISEIQQNQIILPSNIIATNPEFYSYKSNFVNYNVPIYLRIRIQSSGETIENDLKVKFIISDSNHIKTLGTDQQICTELIPNEPPIVIDNFGFIISEKFTGSFVPIRIMLYRNNCAMPIYIEKYSLKMGSLIENVKLK